MPNFWLGRSNQALEVFSFQVLRHTRQPSELTQETRGVGERHVTLQSTLQFGKLRFAAENWSESLLKSEPSLCLASFLVG
jgi:hypothetical protein